jgi:hypothetical protein
MPRCLVMVLGASGFKCLVLLIFIVIFRCRLLSCRVRHFS